MPSQANKPYNISVDFKAPFERDQSDVLNESMVINYARYQNVDEL